jgi:hypothetical protein
VQAVGDIMQVFFSYAYQDEKLAQQFMNHLAYLKDQKDVQFWYEGKIRAGDRRKSVITSMLETADLILLFITPDFISSTDCYEFDMKQALERHNAGTAHVVPILVKPVVSWNKAPFRELQAIPKNGKPITTWRDRDTGWVAVAEQIYELLQALRVDNEKNNEFEARTCGLTFAHITLDQQNEGWCGSDLPVLRGLSNQENQLSFYLCDAKHLSDPGFDITLLNTTSRPLILTKVGIEIDSASHPLTLSVRPHASRIERATSYAIELPDVLTDNGPFDDEPSSLHKVISIDIPDPIYMPAEAPFRYGLLLHNYCQHMPQETNICMWIQTSAGIAMSSLIHLSLVISS